MNVVGGSGWVYADNRTELLSKDSLASAFV